MNKSGTKLMHKNFYRFHELMDDKSIPEEQKKIAETVFALLNKRLEKNVSQDELAKKSGLSKSMISKVETFYSTPSAITLFKYAGGLDMELVFVEGATFRAVQKKRSE